MISKMVQIDGKEVPFRASATVPRLYRAKFKRDIFRDLIALNESVKSHGAQEERQEGVSSLPIDDLEMFENIAYIMAKHADPDQPDTPEEWLDQFDTFSIYTTLPQILSLWNLNMHQTSEAKKKLNQAAGK